MIGIGYVETGLGGSVSFEQRFTHRRFVGEGSVNRKWPRARDGQPQSLEAAGSTAQVRQQSLMNRRHPEVHRRTAVDGGFESLFRIQLPQQRGAAAADQGGVDATESMLVAYG